MFACISCVFAVSLCLCLPDYTSLPEVLRHPAEGTREDCLDSILQLVNREVAWSEREEKRRMKERKREKERKRVKEGDAERNREIEK